jgi:AcrR family transcriptional regulator
VASKFPDKRYDVRSESDSSQRAQFVADVVTERITDTINTKAAKRTAKVNAKAQHHLASLDRLAAHLDALDVWTRAEPGRRKPRFTRDDIASAAIRIADAEGLDAVSMRRIAADLDSGTMTLYHYVKTKDELLTLVVDAVMGEVTLPDGFQLPDDWRQALTVVATRSRDALLRHPWMLDMHDDPPIGPNSVRHFDQSYQAVAGLPISLAERMELIMGVDEYVFGHCMHARSDARPDSDEYGRSMLAYVGDLLATGDYPSLSAMAQHEGMEAAWQQMQSARTASGRFERNLTRLLDGFEQEFAQR